MEKKKDSKKKTTTKKKTTVVAKKPQVKKTTSKNKKTKKKEAFTLIELLAVIIILGIIMVIAIPSVTKYISNSRKESYATTAKSIVDGAKTKVNEGNLPMFDPSVTYYLPYDMIETETGGSRTPFGKMEEAYAVVTYETAGYDYYWTSIDSSKTGISLTSYSNIDKKSIESNMEGISTDIAICGKEKIIVFNKDGTIKETKDAEECIEKNGSYNASQSSIPAPASFATDSWATIRKAARTNNTTAYHVGDTRDIDLGSFGIYKIRITNMSKPSECSSPEFSQTACGYVFEFERIITTHLMNTYTQNGNVNGDGNRGGWEYSSIRTYLNNEIYNAFPDELKNIIIDTKVVSGHGSKDTANIVTTDKLYLLSTHEVWEDVDGDENDGISYYDTAYYNTRQLDYYKNLNTNSSSFSGARKRDKVIFNIWWLRSSYYMNEYNYYRVLAGGNTSIGWPTYENGISPAFRIG